MMRKEALDRLYDVAVRIEEWGVRDKDILDVFEIAQALNPPIKVTQAVLDAMEKVPYAKFRVLEAGLFPQLFKRAVACETDKNGKACWIYGKDCYYDSWVDGIEKKLKINYNYIQADCNLALQVLLQFNTEGELFDA